VARAGSLILRAAACRKLGVEATSVPPACDAGYFACTERTMFSASAHARRSGDW